MKIKIIFSIVLLTVILVLLGQAVDIQEVTRLLHDFSIPLFILILLLATGIQFLKAVRLYILIRHVNIRISFWKIIKISLAGQFTSSLPGGELFRGVLIRKETNAKLITSSGPIILQAILEILTAILITAIGSVAVEELRIPAFVLLFVVGIIFYFLFHETLLKKSVEKLPKYKYTNVLTKQIISIHEKIQTSMINSKKTSFTKILFQTIGIITLSNVIGGVIIYLIAQSFQVDLTIFQSIFVYSSSIVISSIGGISPGGLGFTEGGMTGILLLFGVALPQGVTIVILFRLVTFVFGTITGMVFTGLFYGKTILFKGNEKR